MKKLLSIVAGASLLASTAAMAESHGDDAVKVYGGASASLSILKTVKDAVGGDVKENSGHFINNESSKFGIKGSSKISDNLKAIYQIELGIAIDNNEVDLRDSFVGLQGGFGTVKLGRITPFSDKTFLTSSVTDEGLVTGAVRAPGATEDPNFDAGSVNDIEINYFANTFDSRVNNAIEYVTPKIAGFQLGLTLSPDEKEAYEEGSASTTAATTESSITDNTRLGLVYESPIGLSVAFGIVKDGNNRYTDAAAAAATVALNRVADIDAQVVNIAYTTDLFKVGVLTATYKDNREEKGNKEEVSMTGLYADYYAGSFAVGLNYGLTTIKWPDAPKEDADVNYIELGTTYKLNPSLKLLGNYASTTVSGGAGGDGVEDQNEEQELKIGFKSSF